MTMTTEVIQRTLVLTYFSDATSLQRGIFIALTVNPHVSTTISRFLHRAIHMAHAQKIEDLSVVIDDLSMVGLSAH